MNIQIKIQTLLLLIVTSMQCMEQEVLTLNSRIIRTFIKVNTENRFYIPGFSRQRDRILLLQQLADQGAHITFSSTDTEIPSWLDKDIDTTQKNLYKLFSFLRYNKNTTQVAVQHTCSEEPKKLTHILCLNNDALWITTKKTLKNEQKTILHLLNEYEYNNKTTHVFQPAPDQELINAWHKYLQLIKDGMDLIKPIKPFPSMGSVCRDQGIFKLSNNLIGELIKINQETTCTKSTHSRARLKKLKLLDQLVKEKVDITFNNENITCLIKDAEVFQKNFYDKFFLLLDYDNSTGQAATYHTSIRNLKRFASTICLNNSLLHIVALKRLPEKIKQQLNDFLEEYQNPAHTEPIDRLLEAIKTEEPLPQPYFAESGVYPEPVEGKGKPTELTNQTEVTPDIQEEPQKNLTIEGEIVELNGFELDRIVLRHKENKIVQKLQILSKEYTIRQELKMFINDHI